jgi:hypothetical protein
MNYRMSPEQVVFCGSVALPKPSSAGFASSHRKLRGGRAFPSIAAGAN